MTTQNAFLTFLGSLFMQAFYTAFDYENSTISFAKPAVIERFIAPKLSSETKTGLSVVLITAIVLGVLLIFGVPIYFYYKRIQKRKSVSNKGNQPPEHQQDQFPQYSRQANTNQGPGLGDLPGQG